MYNKILLINPYGTEQSGYINPPLGLLYLAGSLLPEGFDVEVIDGCKEGKDGISEAIRNFGPDVVGITCYTPGRNNVLEIAQIAKDINFHIKVILGGVHPTIMFKQLLENYPQVDYIMLGEGEKTFIEFAKGNNPESIDGIAFIKDGKFFKTKPREYIENLDEIPFPAWHLIDFNKYDPRGEGIFRDIDLAKVPRVSVVFSRGCIGHCTFCSTWWIWRGWRHRSPKNMTDEIEMLNKKFGIVHFCFADDAMTIDHDATILLCDEIIKRDLKIAFEVTTRTDCVDKEMLSKLFQAGCYKISYGVETGSATLLKKMNKENTIEATENAIKLTKQAGIKVNALIIAGCVGEDNTTLNETLDFLRKCEPDEIGCVGGLWILPGTKLYYDCKKDGIIDDNFWLGNEPYMIYTKEHSLEELDLMYRRVLNFKLSDAEFFKVDYKRYYRYKILSKITFGKLRLKYKKKYIDQKTNIQNAIKMR